MEQINQYNETTSAPEYIANKRKADKKDIPIVEDNDFSLTGYEVVRGEFFAHTFEPSITFSNNKVYVNTACIRKLPDIEYVQILVNQEQKRLVVRPCQEDARDSFRWCSSGNKRAPKQVTCRVFYGKILSLMNWNASYRYKLLGKLIKSNNELLFVFDLTTAETFVSKTTADNKVTTSRTASYPSEWKNQFGIPVEEHQNTMQIDMFEGYTVFGVQEQLRRKRKQTQDNAQAQTDDATPPTSNTAESEELTYEQTTLFETTNPIH